MPCCTPPATQSRGSRLPPRCSIARLRLLFLDLRRRFLARLEMAAHVGQPLAGHPCHQRHIVHSPKRRHGERRGRAIDRNRRSPGQLMDDQKRHADHGGYAGHQQLRTRAAREPLAFVTCARRSWPKGWPVAASLSSRYAFPGRRREGPSPPVRPGQGRRAGADATGTGAVRDAGAGRDAGTAGARDTPLAVAAGAADSPRDRASKLAMYSSIVHVLLRFPRPVSAGGGQGPRCRRPAFRRIRCPTHRPCNRRALRSRCLYRPSLIGCETGLPQHGCQIDRRDDSDDTGAFSVSASGNRSCFRLHLGFPKVPCSTSTAAGVLPTGPTVARCFAADRGGPRRAGPAARFPPLPGRCRQTLRQSPEQQSESVKLRPFSRVSGRPSAARPSDGYRGEPGNEPPPHCQLAIAAYN